eukprot:253384-Hanusia_phi.AAC.1
MVPSVALQCATRLGPVSGPSLQSAAGPYTYSVTVSGPIPISWVRSRLPRRFQVPTQAWDDISWCNNVRSFKFAIRCQSGPAH